MFRVTWKFHIQICHDGHFVLIQQTGIDQMVECGKTLFNAWRHIDQDHCQTQTYIAHDCTAHYTATFVLQMGKSRIVEVLK
jgi:hypothetical protein